MAHATFVKAFSYASAALQSPFLCSQLIFAAIYGYLRFGDALTARMVPGSLLVAVAGLIT